MMNDERPNDSPRLLRPSQPLHFSKTNVSQPSSSSVPRSAFGGADVDDNGKKRSFTPFYLELLESAPELGIDDFGFAPVSDATTFGIFTDAVRRGATAGLRYLEENVDARRSPRSVLPNAQTLVVVVLSQRRLRAASGALFEALSAATSAKTSAPPSSPQKICGTVLEYAVSLDYHDVLRQTLRRLQTLFRAHFPNATSRAAVDTAPILEKDWAVRADLGFCGLHSLLIHRRFGSRLFLGELLVSTPFEELTGFSTPETLRAAVKNDENAAASSKSQETDASTSKKPRFSPERCLSCRRCVDACPTDALAGDRTLDARRCLNFWTIENRDEIPPEIARKLDGRLFGCDRCQRVCPWNANDDAEPKPFELAALDALDDATFRQIFKKTPIFRARLDGLRRVAAALRENAAAEMRK